MRKPLGPPLVTTLLFAACVVLYFLRCVPLPYKIAYPVALLAVATFASGRKQLLPVGAALLLSAVGDGAGAHGAFLAQMFFFALAHIAYMSYFLPRARRVPTPLSAAVVGIPLLYLFFFFVPRAVVPAERIGVGLYGLVIAGMLYSVFQYRGACAAGFRCAALLFVFSDATIAWSRFIGPIPGRAWIVMSTYYLAQYLFFAFAFRAARSCPQVHGRTSPPTAPSGSGGNWQRSR